MMLPLKKILISSSLSLFALMAAEPAMANFSLKKPYIEFSAGGSAELAQSSHGTLQSTFTGPIFAMVNDTTNSNIYGRMQQQNAFGPVINMAVGAYLNEIIRVALSLSYFSSAQVVRTVVTDSQFGFGQGTTTSYYNVKTWLGLANVYANLGSLFPLLSPQTQPYVGVGLGVANNRMGTQSTYYDALGLGGTSLARTSRNFAYKLMAGIDFSLTQHLLFDVQYAFVSAGHTESGITGYSSTDITFASPKPYQFPLYANQFTAGLVYQFS